MSSSSESEYAPPETPVLEVVELKRSLLKRFYEPIVFFLALTMACKHNQVHKVLNTAPSINVETPDQLFRDYVNKLCQICDSRPKGSTITAMSILQHPDHIEYRFASNQRDEEDEQRAKEFLLDILRTLRDWSKPTHSLVKTRLLRKIIAFNRARLQLYIRFLSSSTDQCLELSKVQEISEELPEKLGKLQKILSGVNNKSLDEKEFFPQCMILMLFINNMSNTPLAGVILEQANKEPGNAWCEFRHTSRRLLSYYQALQTFIEVRKKWEQLFHEIVVRSLRSSDPMTQNPLPRKAITADAIIGRMTGNLEQMSAYRANAAQLQKFGLDGHIKAQVEKTSFRPLVHAELLIHESIVAEAVHAPGGSPHSSQFFNEQKYIGCSKPTCRLCDYYLAECDSGVDYRASHKNVYPNWKHPAVFKHQGKTGLDRMSGIINRMNKRMRDDTFRLLAEKIPQGKKHDSNTEQTFPGLPKSGTGTSLGYTTISERGSASIVGGEGFDDITSRFSVLDIGDSTLGGHALRGQGRPVRQHLIKPDIIQEEVEEDEGGEDGGVSLS